MPTAPARRDLDMEVLAQLVEADYAEMPGLQLTAPQLRKLWNLSGDDWAELEDVLLLRGRIRRDRMGRYVLRVPA